MKILISGATGLVGRSLVSSFKQEDVFTLVREKGQNNKEIVWDPHDGVKNPETLEGFDVVIHLAGESIQGRWTEKKKQEIFQSRVEGTQSLVRNLLQLKRPPKTLICASAVGFYGDRQDKLLTEDDEAGQGFLALVCQKWEKAAKEAEASGIRVLNLRLGMVLSPDGGALKKMIPLFKWGLGGPVGDGKQYISWIALEDLVSIIHFAIRENALKGPINCVSPHPVTNEEFTKTLGKTVHRPTFFFLPSFAVNLLLGEMGKELLLSSTRVLPKKLEEQGYRFQYPQLNHTLSNLITLQ